MVTVLQEEFELNKSRKRLLSYFDTFQLYLCALNDAYKYENTRQIAVCGGFVGWFGLGFVTILVFRKSFLKRKEQQNVVVKFIKIVIMCFWTSASWLRVCFHYVLFSQNVFLKCWSILHIYVVYAIVLGILLLFFQSYYPILDNF